MKNKFYYYANTDLRLDNKLNNYKAMKENVDDLKFVYVVSEKDILADSSIAKLAEETKQLLSSGVFPHDIIVAVDTQDRKFTPEEWETFRNVKESLSKKGIEFGFNDMKNIWSVNQVEKANKQVVNASNQINKQHLSPYEKLIYAYSYVTGRRYIAEREGEHTSTSRSVFGVLNSNRIVCVGFSEWLKAIMEEIGDENIKVFSNNVACSNDGKSISDYHENLIIYVKDEKYNIDGYYYCDPTWDCGHEKLQNLSLCHFMVPLKDIDKIKVNILDYNSKLPFARSTSVRNSENKKSKTKREQNYNHKDGNAISFSSDKFTFTKEFMEDFFMRNTNIAEKYLDDIKIASLMENSEEFENNNKEIKVLNEIIDKIKTGEIRYISKYTADKLRSGDCDTSFVLSEINQIDESNNDVQSYIVESVNEAYNQKISPYTEKIKLFEEDREQYKEEYLESLKSLLKDSNDNPVFRKMGAEKDWDIHCHDNDVKNLENLRKLRVEDIEFINKTLNENPDLVYKLKYEKNLDIRIINLHPNNYKKIEERMNDFIEEVDKYIALLPAENIINLLEQKIDNIKEQNNELTQHCEMLFEVDLTNNEALEELCYQSVEDQEFLNSIEKYLKKRSVPIDFALTLKAFEEMYKKVFKVPNCVITNTILANNCKKIKDCMKPEASHSLMEYANTYDENMLI